MGNIGGKCSRAGRRQPHRFIHFSSPALVTSKACSHAAQCLPWIIETTPCPAKSSPLNSLPRHSDTLQPRRDSFTLKHRNPVLAKASGDSSAQRAAHHRPPLARPYPHHSHSTEGWPLTLRKHDPLTQIRISGTVSFGLSLHWREKCCHRFCRTLLAMIHRSLSVLFYPKPLTSCLF